MTETKDKGGRELYYVDKDGKKQDAALWDEILGDDDQDVIQLEDLAEPGDESESGGPTVQKLEQEAPLGRTHFRR